MTDETTQETAETPKELLFYDEGVSLLSQNWGFYTRDAKVIQDFLNLKKEIEDKMAANEPVYVQIMDERRKGSVGRLSTITFEYRAPNTSTSSYWNRNDHFISVRDIEVIWDKRKNKVKPYTTEVEYLPTWDAGTEWHWTPGPSQEKPPRIIPYDHLGEEIEPGQFVCFVHRRYGNISMKFGTVTRLTDRGGVFVKSLKLKDGDSAGQELKALDAEDLIIVSDKLMGRLMMARLSAD
jgi:hypothetical protein